MDVAVVESVTRFLSKLSCPNTSFAWIIDRSSNPIAVGVDMYDYDILVYKNDGSIALRYGPINTDSSSTKVKEQIRGGVYSVVAAYHLLKEPSKSSPAFFIMRCLPDALKFSSIDAAYNSVYRTKLPSLHRASTAYINFHKGGKNTDASEGCFTAEPSSFLKFRSAFADLTQGVLLFINRSDPLWANVSPCCELELRALKGRSL